MDTHVDQNEKLKATAETVYWLIIKTNLYAHRTLGTKKEKALNSAQLPRTQRMDMAKNKNLYVDWHAVHVIFWCH